MATVRSNTRVKEYQKDNFSNSYDCADVVENGSPKFASSKEMEEKLIASIDANTDDKNRKRKLAPRANSNKYKRLDAKKYSEIIMNYDVDPYDYDDEDLVTLAIEIFRYFDIFNKVKMDETSLRNFLNAVRKLYNPENSFHNFKHVWCVMHLSFHILIKGAEKYLEILDIVAVLISSICHDIGHPGNNNAFEMATHSDISKLYAVPPHEICVLERHHASLTQTLLNSHKSNQDILKTLTKPQKEHFFRQIAFIIMGTDMGRHAELVEEAKLYMNSGNSSYSQNSSVNGDGNNSDSSHNNNNNNNGIRSKTNSQDENDQNVGSLSPLSENHIHDEDTALVTAAVIITRNKNKLRREKEKQKKIDNKNAANNASSNSSNPNNTNGASTTTSSSHHNHNSSNSNSTINNKHDRDKEYLQAMAINRENPESRVAFTRVIVHCADIGAQTQCELLAHRWADRCYDEFRMQASKEKQLGLVTSPFIHEICEDSKKFASQYDFINGIVEPIWKAMSDFLPDLKFAYEQLISNKLSYTSKFTR